MSILGTTRKRDSHIWEREANEHYVEPTWCSERLFNVEVFNRGIWDPCCGFGRIPDAARSAGLSAVATDIVDRGYGLLNETMDFLNVTMAVETVNVVCNPPFNIAEKFAKQALKLASEKVAIIFPTARLNAARWINSTPLRRIWLLTPRPSMPPGYVISSGQKPSGGKMDFCWLVWERKYLGRPEICWLHRDTK